MIHFPFILRAPSPTDDPSGYGLSEHDAQIPTELRDVNHMLDMLASHERAAAPAVLEESIFLSLSLHAAGREAMDAAPADLEDRIFAATRGVLAAQPPTAAQALKLVGEGELPRDPRLSPDAVRRALMPRTTWWRSPALRAAAVFAILCVPAFTLYMSLRSSNTSPADIARTSEPVKPSSEIKVALTQIDAEVDTLMNVFDDTLPESASTSGSQPLDDDWFGMAEFLSEGSL